MKKIPADFFKKIKQMGMTDQVGRKKNPNKMIENQ